MGSSWGGRNAGDGLAWLGVLLARDGCCDSDIAVVGSVRRVVLRHPVRGSLAKALSIVVDGRVLIVVGFGIVDEPLAVALDLGEGSVFSTV